MPLQIDLTFVRNRDSQRRMALIWLACLALGVAYRFLAPKWYVSGLAVVPAKSSRSAGLASMLGGDLAGLASSLDPGSSATADPARIVAVLQSNSVADAVIEKFKLRERYGDRYLEDARADLWRHCAARALTRPGLVQATCEDTDPAFAQAMLSFLVERGNEVFQRVSVSSASEEARFLEGRAAVLRAQADATSDRMREFQETHRIVDLDSQARSVVNAMAGLQGQRINKQLELEFARTYATADEATTRQMESQLALVSEKLRSLESPAAGNVRPSGSQASGPGIFPVALEVPRLRAEYERLYRDRRVAEASLIVALDRLENARANAARDVSTFQILDPASLPTKQARPRLIYALLVAMVLGVLLSVALELVLAARAARGGRLGPPGGGGAAAPAAP